MPLIGRLLRVYRGPLFGLGVVLPGIIIAIFWEQRIYLNPIYWNRDGLLMVLKYNLAEPERPPANLTDWGDGTIPPPSPNILAIARLLRARDYAGLEALAKRAPADFNSFRDTSPDLAGMLDEWIAAEPTSTSARLARGHYWYNIGWTRRGEKLASATTRAQFRDQRDAFDQAEADFLAAVKFDPSITIAYPRLLRIYSTERSRNAALSAIWLRAIDAGAATTQLHRALFIALMPRWSRLSYAESIAAIRAVVGEIENGSLRGTGDPELLRAFPEFVEAEGLWRSDHRDEALQLYATFIDGSSSLFFLDDYAGHLRYAGRHAESLKFYAASLRYQPSIPDVLEGYADMLSRVRHYDKAEIVLERALALDPYHPDILLARGDLNVTRGRLREALADFERAEVHGDERSAVAVRVHWVRSKLDE